MKRAIKYLMLTALVALAALPAAGQHYVGFKGGYGGAQGRFYPLNGIESRMMWNNYNGGVMWKYYSPQQVVGGVSAELEYQTRGYRAFAGVVSDTTRYTSRTRRVNSITLPLIWQPHLYLANRHVRVFLNAGVTLTYNLDTGGTTTFSEYGFDSDGNRTVTSETSGYKMITARDVRWGYGFCGGFGFGVLFGRWEVFAEARYYYGMSDLLRNVTKYQFVDVDVSKTTIYPVIRSEMDNLFVTVGVFFRLGKGGITEAPLKKRKGPPVGDNDFRNIRLSF